MTTPNPLKELLQNAAALTVAAQLISNRLEAMAAQRPPDWHLPLLAYKSPWPGRIGAHVLASDEHGVTKVVWSGHTYTRRCGSNRKYGVAIWFSRALGSNGDENEYGRLITFKDCAPAEPLPQYVIKALNNLRE